MIRLNLQVTPSGLPLFYSLLEKGVVLSVRTGCTLRSFLCGQIGLSDDYLDQRVQTLFLDARPVDDVDTAVVKDGAILALSTAMPGLLGATMRKGGRYAAFRRDISQAADECGICETSGKVTVKLFNMVAREVGGPMMETGVEVSGSDLARIADRYSQELDRTINRVRKDDQEIAPDASIFPTLKGQRVIFSVSVEK